MGEYDSGRRWPAACARMCVFNETVCYYRTFKSLNLQLRLSVFVSVTASLFCHIVTFAFVCVTPPHPTDSPLTHTSLFTSQTVFSTVLKRRNSFSNFIKFCLLAQVCLSFLFTNRLTNNNVTFWLHSSFEVTLLSGTTATAGNHFISSSKKWLFLFYSQQNPESSDWNLMPQLPSLPFTYMFPDLVPHTHGHTSLCLWWKPCIW